MDQLKFKLKASTLIESLVAMVIIIVGLGVGTMIYTNVLNADKQLLKMKAMGTLNRLADEIKNENNFIDEEQLIENLKVKKTVEKYDQTENLYLLNLIAYDENKNIVAIRNELILIE